MNILISCNNTELRDRLLSHLTLKHVTSIKSCHCGSHAIEMAMHHPIDIALIASDLSDYDPLLLIEDMQRAQPNLHVLYLSEFHEAQEVINAYAAKNIACLKIPFHQQELEQQFHSLLHRTRATPQANEDHPAARAHRIDKNDMHTYKDLEADPN